MHDAVGSGSAAISRFLIAPNDKVYVVFSTSVDLDNASPTAWTTGARCLIAVVDPASGKPTCVDSQLGHINWSGQQGSNPPIQFDAAGAIYYTGYTTSGKTVLRRYLNGVATDLINDNISVYDFLVRPDGSVYITGTSSTGASWVRRISPSGAPAEPPIDNQHVSARVPGRKHLHGLWNSNDFGVRRYQTASGAIDPKYWIGNSGQSRCGALHGLETTARAARPLGSAAPPARMSRAPIRPAMGRSSRSRARAPKGRLMQYYPDVSVPTTAVKKVSVAQSVITNLILAGRNEQDQNVLTLYNTTAGTERQLLGPENEIEIYHLNYVANGNKVLFDGLRFADNKYVLGQVDLSTNDGHHLGHDQWQVGRLPNVRLGGDHTRAVGPGSRRCSARRRRRRIAPECYEQCYPAAHGAAAGKEKRPVSRAFLRADGRTRTGDPFITSEVLYQLSYVGQGRPEG